MASTKSPLHHSGKVVIIILCSMVGIIAAYITFFAAAYLITNSIVLYLLAFLAGFLITTVCTYIPIRKIYISKPLPLASCLGVATMIVAFVIAQATFLHPLANSTAVQAETPQAPAGLTYWNLDTGSHIAYLKIPAYGVAKKTPIIIVGGGPGEEDVANTSEVNYFGQFAKWGYNVYFYDQLGSGLSERLADPKQYTVARHVADLNAIITTIGAKQAILIGSSWGGTLVANFMAAHPQRVEKAIFTSPAPISYGEWGNFGDPSVRLTPQGKQTFKKATSSPEFIAWYLLGKINPKAAHNLVSDQQADAFFDTFLKTAYPGTVCNPAHLPDTKQQGNGFYDNIFTSESAQKQNGIATRNSLATNYTPVLIVTGSCNYIKWAPTWQYKSTFPNSTLLYIQDAGHEIYIDQPELYFAAVKAFLLDTALPIKPWNNAQPPPSFKNF